MKYTLFDGQFHQKLKPLTFTKPVSLLRVGFYTIKEKWESFLNEEVGIRTKHYLGLKFNSKYVHFFSKDGLRLVWDIYS